MLCTLFKGGVLALEQQDKTIVLLCSKNLLEALSRHIKNNPKEEYINMEQLEVSADHSLVGYHMAKYKARGYEVIAPRNTEWSLGWAIRHRSGPNVKVVVLAKTRGNMYVTLGEFQKVMHAKEYIKWVEGHSRVIGPVYQI